MGKSSYFLKEAASLLDALEKNDAEALAALGVKSLEEINYIFLSGIRVSALPAEIGQLKNLQSLYLSETQIAALPVEIGRLVNLQTLTLGETPIAALPAEIGQLANLLELYLDGTHLAVLPAEIGQLANLKLLNLRKTQIAALPEEIGQLASLRILDMSGTLISALPAEIGQLECLRELNFDETQIAVLPAEVGQLKNLQSLNLRGTQIAVLPEEIGQLKYLNSLYLEGSNIASLPHSMHSLTKLKELSFGNTNIRVIPKWINQLTALKYLSISGLRLREIPKEVFELGLPFFLSSSEYEKSRIGQHARITAPGIIIEGTSLATQPVSLFALDRKFIKAYYDEPKVPVREGKVIFLGDGNAGKSHTIERIFRGGRDDGINTDKTPGINIKTWEPECGDKKIKINFWDFGGQEIMHAMHRCFLTGRSLYVVVLRERSNSRHNDLTLQARYWLENIRSFAPDCPVILAVNREIGVPGTSGINTRQLRDMFKGIIGEPIIYCAKKDTDDNFDTLTNAILEHALELDSTEMEFPISWNNVRSELDSMSNRRGRTGSEYYISKEEYKQLCLYHSITDENIQRWLLEWFNDLGVCFSYHQKDGKELDRYQVLNPEWLTNAIYAVINIGKRPDFSENGVITKAEINEILRDPTKYTKGKAAESALGYNDNEQGYVLDIMKKFDLCAEISDRNYFIPALCSPETPERFRPGKEEYKNHTRFEFRYGFLPDSVMHRLMIECIKSGFSRTAAYFCGIRVDFKADSIVMTVESDTAKNVLAIDIYHNDDVEASRKKLSWVRRKVVEINASMNLKPEYEIIVVCDGENRADLRLDTLFKLHELGRKRTDLSAYSEGEIVECDLTLALKLLYDERVIKRANLIRNRKRPDEKEKLSFKEALAIADAKKENEEERDKAIKAGNELIFELGVSYAGEQRSLVAQAFTFLCDNYGFAKNELFYDKWHEPLLNGPNGDIKLDKIYSDRCKKIVVLFSREYLEKHWTNELEWTRAITARITHDPNNVCLLRYGDVDIDSIDLLHGGKDIVHDVSEMTPDEVADFIMEWYDRPEL